MALALSQLQPYLATCTTKVLKCVEGKAEQEEKLEEKKGTKKGAKPTESAKTVYDVELEQSVLFPKGGGQPSDVGELVYEKGQKEVKLAVSAVFRDPSGRVIHRTESPLAEGTEVKVVVDWEKRYDHMQQHSAQHLISAVADKICGAETLSWWLASYPDACNIDFHQEISPAHLEEILNACNSHIRNGINLGMHVFHSLEEAAQHPAFRSGKHPVPANMSGPLRVIEIPGVDYNKCCGTHLKSTAEMQIIQFVKTEKLKGMFRVHYLAGGRSVSAALTNLDVCKQLSTAMCTSISDLPVRVNKLQADSKALKKSLERAHAELAELEALKLASQGTKFVSLHKAESDLEYMSAVASALGQAPGGQEILALLTFTEGPAGSKEGGFLLAGSADSVKAVGPRVATALEGRGGGRPGRYQGKAARLDQLSGLVATLQSEFGSASVSTTVLSTSGPKKLGFCSNLECAAQAVVSTQKGSFCASCTA